MAIRFPREALLGPSSLLYFFHLQDNNRLIVLKIVVPTVIPNALSYSLNHVATAEPCARGDYLFQSLVTVLLSGGVRALQNSVGRENDEVTGPLPIRFGRYTLLKLLGKGGMGSVYLAQDTQLNRQVALKVPHFNGPESFHLREWQRLLRAQRSLDDRVAREP